MIEKSRLKGK